MTSNKTTSRNTNDGYLGRSSSSLKNSQTTNHDIRHKRTNSKSSGQSQSNQNASNNKQTTYNAYKHQEIPYVVQSQEQDSESQYSFNKKPQISNNFYQPSHTNSNTNGKPSRTISKANTQKKKSSEQDRSKNAAKGTAKQLPSKELPIDQNQNQKHSNTETNQPLKKTQIPSTYQDKIQLLEQLLKQAHYENQLLRSKLLLSQNHSQTLNLKLSQIQHHYNQLQQNHQQLQEKHSELTAKLVSVQTYIQFVSECQSEMHRLKNLVKDLSDQKIVLQMRQSPSERQEIKDRIILKLQDQLITHKLLLQQSKIHNHHNHPPLTEITSKYNNNRSFQEEKQQLNTNRTRYSPRKHKGNLNIYSANKQWPNY